MKNILLFESFFNKNQGVVSDDKKSITVTINVPREISKKVREPYIYWEKYIDGVLVRVSVKEPTEEDKENWVKKKKFKTKEVKSFIEETKQVELSFKKSDYSLYKVYTPNREIVGYASIVDSEDKKNIHISKVEIDVEYTGQGVANALYDYIEMTEGKIITRDTKGLYKAITDDGKRLWNRRNNKL